MQKSPLDAQEQLDMVNITSPCPVDWSSMKGDQNTRFCSLCKLHVYNLSEMTKEQAESFLHTNTEVCVRLYWRADGTILTKDCHAVRMQLQGIVSSWHRAAAVFASFVFATLASFAGSNHAANIDRVSEENGQSLPLLQSSVTKKFEPAAIEFDKGNFANALSLLKAINVTKSIEVEERHYLKALCQQVLGQFDESASEYGWVIKHSVNAVLRAKAEMGLLQAQNKQSCLSLAQMTGSITTNPLRDRHWVLGKRAPSITPHNQPAMVDSATKDN